MDENQDYREELKSRIKNLSEVLQKINLILPTSLVVLFVCFFLGYFSIEQGKRQNESYMMLRAMEDSVTQLNKMVSWLPPTPLAKTKIIKVTNYEERLKKFSNIKPEHIIAYHHLLENSVVLQKYRYILQDLQSQESDGVRAFYKPTNNTSILIQEHLDEVSEIHRQGIEIGLWSEPGNQPSVKNSKNPESDKLKPCGNYSCTEVKQFYQQISRDKLKLFNVKLSAILDKNKEQYRYLKSTLKRPAADLKNIQKAEERQETMSKGFQLPIFDMTLSVLSSNVLAAVPQIIMICFIGYALLTRHFLYLKLCYLKYSSGSIGFEYAYPSPTDSESDITTHQPVIKAKIALKKTPGAFIKMRVSFWKFVLAISAFMVIYLFIPKNYKTDLIPVGFFILLVIYEGIFTFGKQPPYFTKLSPFSRNWYLLASMSLLGAGLVIYALITHTAFLEVNYTATDLRVWAYSLSEMWLSLLGLWFYLDVCILDKKVTAINP